MPLAGQTGDVRVAGVRISFGLNGPTTDVNAAITLIIITNATSIQNLRYVLWLGEQDRDEDSEKEKEDEGEGVY